MYHMTVLGNDGFLEGSSTLVGFVSAARRPAEKWPKANVTSVKGSQSGGNRFGMLE